MIHPLQSPGGAACALVVLLAAAAAPRSAGEEADGRSPAGIECAVRPAVPNRFCRQPEDPCSVRRGENRIHLANRFLVASIEADSGVLRDVASRVPARSFALTGDEAGAAIVRGSERREMIARQGVSAPLRVAVEETPEAVSVVFRGRDDWAPLTLAYRLARDRFWIERTVSVDAPGDGWTLDRLVYGRLDAADAAPRVLDLGRFDRPTLASIGPSGLFGGVGWWFSERSDGGLYQNAAAGHPLAARFESEPWYLGVFAEEPGDPFPGWLWYRQFLQMRKDEHDRQPAWLGWNAGWGQWGIDVDDPAAGPYFDLAARLGVQGICLGGGAAGKGMPAYPGLARESAVARDNLARLRRHGIAAGVLHGPVTWEDDAVFSAARRRLDDFAAAGFRAAHFDFFQAPDTFAAHRRVAEFFRAARERLDYTECHLGMAAYGPQFQREVLVNHPDDLAEHPIDAFSADWATFLGFRYSRRRYQDRAQGLIPECGLYYFTTHYSNWGHARRYADPEPQQFLYGPHAYCGVAFNLHDAHGFRDALAAASAFTMYPVFGHLDLRMPESDVAWARGFGAWVRGNAAALRPARVCHEDGHVAVVSKIRDGRGTLHLVNYREGARRVRLRWTLGTPGPLRVRAVYPARSEAFEVADGEATDVRIPGGRTLIYDVNGGLGSLPPENAGAFPVEVAAWTEADGGWTGTAEVPDVRHALAKAADPSLPKEFAALDGTDDATAKWIGLGPLPAPFLAAHGFREGGRVEAWKFAPWAYADRVWLVLVPPRPSPLEGPRPEASVNGTRLALIPRVDYRAKPWTCPLWFADATAACRFGAPNAVRVSGLPAGPPPACALHCAADRR